MKKALIMMCLLSLARAGYAQFITTSSSQVVATSGSELSIKTTGNVSIAQDLSTSKINLELSGATQTIAEDLTVRKLVLTGNGDKSINKSLFVTENIDFTLGILKVSTSGKILYTGAIGGITGGNDNSYTDGFFFNQSTGAQLFPVGAAGLGYAPATIINNQSKSEIGIQVVNQSPNFIADVDSEVKRLDNTHYWEVNTTNLADVSSSIKLSLKGVDPTLASGDSLTLAVVQADNVGEVVEGLSGADNSNDKEHITSQKNFTKAFLGVAASKEPTVSVIDIITPGQDGHNDHLNILFIEKFAIRKVRLLDRYGFVIKEWPEYVNGEANGYDFNKLSSGSYICIVEYGNSDTGTRSIQQMVSVIKN
jgi:hypothetical protein